MPDRAADLRSWVLRTIGTAGTSVNDILQHFSIQHPDRDRADLETVLENRRYFLRDEQDRLKLSEEARRELEQLGKHEYTRRVEDAH